MISDFTRFELQFYGNSMYLLDNIRRVLMIVVNITQVDIALFGVLVSQITGVFTIRMLLNEKSFPHDGLSSKNHIV